MKLAIELQIGSASRKNCTRQRQAKGKLQRLVEAVRRHSCPVATSALAMVFLVARPSLAVDWSFAAGPDAVVDLSAVSDGKLVGTFTQFGADGSQTKSAVAGTNSAEGTLKLRFLDKEDDTTVTFRKTSDTPGFVTWKPVESADSALKAEMTAPVYVSDLAAKDLTKKWKWSPERLQTINDYEAYLKDKENILKSVFGAAYTPVPSTQIGIVDQRKNFARWSVASSIAETGGVQINTFGDSSDRAMIAVDPNIFGNNKTRSTLDNIVETASLGQPPNNQPMIFEPDSITVKIPPENIFREYSQSHMLSEPSWAIFEKLFGEISCHKQTPRETIIAYSCIYHSDDIVKMQVGFWINTVILFKIGPQYDDLQYVYLDEETQSAKSSKSRTPEPTEYNSNYNDITSVKYCIKYVLHQIMTNISNEYPRTVEIK